MNPRLKALKHTKDILDGIEELRHINPRGTSIFNTYCDKLVQSDIVRSDFEMLLKKIESEGIASFDLGSGGFTWGGDSINIKIHDWDKFDKYYQEINAEIAKISKQNEEVKNYKRSVIKELKNIRGPKRKLHLKWLIGLVVTAIIVFLAQSFLPQFFLPVPKLEFLLRNEDQNVVIGIKNIGQVGIKNLTITKLSETYLDIPGEYDGFAGTGFAQISEFNNPGENWLTSEYLPPGGIPLEKEMHWSVNGDEYTSVEVFSAYYQRESDLKQFSDRFIFLTRNQKAYTVEEASNDSYLAKIIDQIPEIINKPPSPSRYYHGVKKLK